MVEDDHVFPLCLWRKRDRHGVPFIFVPACKPCNNDKSRYDDALRDRVDLDLTSSGRPDQRDQVELIARSTIYGSSSVGRSARPVVEAAMADPTSATWPLKIPVPPEPFLRAVEYIVRGLYYHETGTVLAKERYTVAVKYLPIDQMTEWFARYNQHPHFGGKLGDVCLWTYNLSTIDASRSSWVLFFKDGVVFLATTNRPRHDD